MPDALSNDDIATLTEIVEQQAAMFPPRLKPSAAASIPALLAAGFIAETGKEPPYKVTKAGLDFMGSRGAGPSEA